MQLNDRTRPIPAQARYITVQRIRKHNGGYSDTEYTFAVHPRKELGDESLQWMQAPELAGKTRK